MWMISSCVLVTQKQKLELKKTYQRQIHNKLLTSGSVGAVQSAAAGFVYRDGYQRRMFLILVETC